MQQMAQKEYKTRHGWMDGKGDQLGIMQRVKIWPCWQIVYVETRIYPRKWDP